MLDFNFLYSNDHLHDLYGLTLSGTRRLFIIGGSPLTNDVWAGDILQDASGSWFLVWEEMASGDAVPFSPRAGLGKPGQRPPSAPAPVASGCEHLRVVH